jgi:folate-binding protein YgfZ
MRQHHTRISEGYTAAAEGAGLVPRGDRGRIVVSGADRASYLQGLLTNDIAALRPGLGCYAAYLTAQGRMIADLWVYELGGTILLSLSRDVKDTVLAKLDQFIFSEDVQLGDVSDTFGAVAVIGPAAGALVQRALDPGDAAAAIPALAEHGNLRAAFHAEPVIVLRVTDLGLPGYELLIDRHHLDGLADVLRSGGAIDLDAETADAFRIEAGIPKFHQDMDEETIPLEAGIEDRAISLTKGCYVGQEVIIRVLHRGHGRVAEKLVGLVIEGEPVPPPKTVVKSGDREVGRVTSSAYSPKLDRPIALAYVQRDFITPGTRVTANELPATVSALPFAQTA